MVTINKTNFLGGIQTQFSPEKSAFADSYALLTNCRVRNNIVEPVRGPLELDIPSGTLQNLSAFDTNLLVFASGIPYYRAISASLWAVISGGNLSNVPARIHTEAIPGSAVNYKRTTGGVIDFSVPVGSSRACVFCADGRSQPIVIFPDGSCRATNAWADWTVDDREYVPICSLPKFVGSKLYVVIKDSDGRATQIAHSVSGRPLDFVLLLNAAGDKAGTTEPEFGAPALRFHVGYDELTALVTLNAADGAFIATSARTTTYVIPDFDRLIAAEPTHVRQPLFNVGSFGPEAITDINGDTAVVYPGGIRTFNGVSQLKFQGKNAPLNRQIQNLTSAGLQTTGATCQFDNYTGFAVTTKYGPGVIWWDQTLEVFVAVDIWAGVGNILEFASVITPTVSKLYFRTDDNKLYEAFAGAYGESQITLHDLSAVSGGETLALRCVSVASLNGVTAGYMTVDQYADRRLLTSVTESVAASDALEDPSARPMTPGTLVPDAKMLDFTFPNPVRAYRSTPVIRWSGDSKISAITCLVEPFEGTNKPAADTTTATNPLKLVFFGDDGVLGASRTALNRLMRAEPNVNAFVGTGDHAYNSGTEAEVIANFKAFWNTEKLAGKLYAVPGNHDLDTGGGTWFFQYVRQTPERYSHVLLNANTEIFLFNTGIETSGAQTDPRNSDGASYLLSSQAQELLQDLANSTARNKIVVWHHPPYTSSATYYPGNTTMQPLAAAIADAGASALVCGHAHLYERLNVHLPIFIVGCAGQTLHSISTTLAVGSMKQIAEYGYLRVSAGPLRCVWEFVDSTGTVRDSFIT